jgi:hypothetical protein
MNEETIEMTALMREAMHDARRGGLDPWDYGFSTIVKLKRLGWIVANEKRDKREGVRYSITDAGRVALGETVVQS